MNETVNVCYSYASNVFTVSLVGDQVITNYLIVNHEVLTADLFWKFVGSVVVPLDSTLFFFVFAYYGENILYMN